MISPEEKFLSSIAIEEETGCWIWQPAPNNAGYGVFRAGSISEMAHRWAYEHWVGPIPGGATIDHFACDRRLCVNPEHLRPASHRENILRSGGVAAANAAKSHCPRGHEYDIEYPDGRRWCRRCANEAQRRWKARRRAAA